MRIACVLITHLRAKAELRRRAHLRDSPIAVVDRTSGKPLVVDTSAGTSARAGMTLEQAMSCHNGLIILDADEPYYRRAFEDVIEALLQVTDRVEPAELGTAYARIDGLELLYGGKGNVAAALLDAVPGWLNARVGVGGSKFTAYIAARSADVRSVAFCPADEGAFLAPLSIELLPLSDDLKRSLHGFGVHTMGQVAVLSRDMLSDRFGREGILVWELCNGIDGRPVVPLKAATSITEYTSLPFSSTSIELLLATTDILLQRAYSRPQLLRRLAGSMTLASTTIDRAPWMQSVKFKEPVGEWQSASRLLRDRIEAQPPNAPVEDLTLTVGDISAESGRQIGLLEDARDRRFERIIDIDRKLRARMQNVPALHRIVDVAPWHPVPEMRALKVPVGSASSDMLTPLHSPLPVEVRESKGCLPLAVQSKKGWQKIRRIDDLWEFELWWLPQPVTRSYFRVVDDIGRQLVLFRDEREGCWYRQPISAA
ncbi:MAG: hypothetical protein OXI16_09965 [Chloroflexota bacterium]|nr:hypothetical protein [Chloroflexota bacterium]